MSVPSTSSGGVSQWTGETSVMARSSKKRLKKPKLADPELHTSRVSKSPPKSSKRTLECNPGSPAVLNERGSSTGNLPKSVLSMSGLKPATVTQTLAQKEKKQFSSSGKILPKGASPGRASLPIGRTAVQALAARNAGLVIKSPPPPSKRKALHEAKKLQDTRDERFKTWTDAKDAEVEVRRAAQRQARIEAKQEEYEMRLQAQKADRAFQNWMDAKEKEKERKTMSSHAAGSSKGPLSVAEITAAFRRLEVKPYSALDPLEDLLGHLDRRGRVSPEKVAEIFRMVELQNQVDSRIAKLDKKEAHLKEHPIEVTQTDRLKQTAEAVQLRIGKQILAKIGPNRKMFGLALTDYRAMFTAMDENGDGVLSTSEFKDGVKRLDLGISSSQQVELLKAFDTDKSGTIDYMEWENWLLDCKAKIERGKPRAPNAKFELAQQLVATFGGKNQVEEVFSKLLSSAQKTRRDIASGKGGTVTASTFKGVVATLEKCDKLNTSQRKDMIKALDSAFRVMDKKRTGIVSVVDLDGFLRMVEREVIFRSTESTISPDEKRKEDIRYRLSKTIYKNAELRRIIPARLLSIIADGLDVCHTSDDGLVNAPEFGRAIRRMELGLPGVQVDDLVRVFESGGMVDVGEFRQYIAGSHDRMQAEIERKRDPRIGICDKIFRDVSSSANVIVPVIDDLHQRFVHNRVDAVSVAPPKTMDQAMEEAFDISWGDKTTGSVVGMPPGRKEGDAAAAGLTLVKKSGYEDESIDEKLNRRDSHTSAASTGRRNSFAQESGAEIGN